MQNPKANVEVNPISACADIRLLLTSLTENQCRGRQGRADGLVLTRCWPKKCAPARKVLPHLAGFREHLLAIKKMFSGHTHTARAQAHSGALPQPLSHVRTQCHSSQCATGPSPCPWHVRREGLGPSTRLRFVRRSVEHRIDARLALPPAHPRYSEYFSANPLPAGSDDAGRLP